MSLGNRSMRGGPAGVGSGRLPEGARMVTPATSKANAERMRAMMQPGRPAGGRLLQERLNVSFFQEAVSEIRKVHWPTRLQARNLTLLVIGVSIGIGILLGAVDTVLAALFRVVVGA